MSTVTESTDEILEGVEDIVDGVTQVARGFSGLALSGAFAIGAGVGGAVAYFVTKRALETKYADKAAEEISAALENYRRKAIALENEASKGTVEALIRERGYRDGDIESPRGTTDAPMAVEPPTAVVEKAATEEESEEVTRTPQVGRSEEVTRRVFPDAPTHEWDDHEERARRTPMAPFVIHLDERQGDPEAEITLTYFEEDDVLCNERDEILDKAKRDEMIGEENLNRFGHGSNDVNAVYIRNPVLEVDFEVVRSPNSYSEEVAGLIHSYDAENELRHSARRGGRRSLDDD